MLLLSSPLHQLHLQKLFTLDFLNKTVKLWQVKVLPNTPLIWMGQWSQLQGVHLLNHKELLPHLLCHLTEKSSVKQRSTTLPNKVNG